LGRRQINFFFYLKRPKEKKKQLKIEKRNLLERERGARVWEVEGK
jgi:hypothetical protein